MGSGEVLAYTLAGAGGRVEKSEIVCHAWPHAGDEDSEKETKEAVGPVLVTSELMMIHIV